MNFEVPGGTVSESDIRDDSSESPTISRVSHTVVTPMRKLVSRYSFRYEDSDKRRLLYFPKRVFRWIYSISLILLLLLTLGFVSVTPVDVIVQTSGASSSGVKMFIVIADCVVFVVISAILYFSRVFQGRIAMNDIPSKSLYVPFEGDLPPVTIKLIESRIRKCIDIRHKAGPLENKSIIINHPGLSPPEYVQRRNISDDGKGTLLPPNIHYEDIVRSLGDNMILKGKLFTNDILPKNKSFRELILYVYDNTIKKVDWSNEVLECPDVLHFIDLYELLRFGSGLIKEEDIFAFIFEFDCFVSAVHHYYSKYHDNDTASKESTVIFNDPFSHQTPSNKDQGSLENSAQPEPELEPEDVFYTSMRRTSYGQSSQNRSGYGFNPKLWDDSQSSSGNSYHSDGSIRIHNVRPGLDKAYSSGDATTADIFKTNVSASNFNLHPISSRRSSGNISDVEDNYNESSRVNFHRRNKRRQ